MEQRTSLTEIIEYIDPGSLSYQDWVNVGMALKLEGYPVSVWDQWSQKDFGRYHAGECERKWRSFSGSSSPVTGGTIVQMAMERGWVPEKGHELDWNDSIQVDSDRVVVDKNWLEGREIQEPKNWNPAEQLITYLETLFEAGENVGYVTGSWEKTDEKGTRWLPQKGIGNELNEYKTFCWVFFCIFHFTPFYSVFLRNHACYCIIWWVHSINISPQSYEIFKTVKCACKSDAIAAYSVEHHICFRSKRNRIFD